MIIKYVVPENQKKIRMNLLFWCVYFASCLSTTFASGLTVSDFSVIKQIQEMFCVPKHHCSLQLGVSNDSSPPFETPTTSTSPYFLQLMSTLPVLPPEKPSLSCCEECSCDIEDCYISGSCCIEILEKLWPISHSNVTITCNYPQLRPYNTNAAYPSVHTPYLMHSICPRLRKVDLEIVNKCEHSDNFQDIETKIPATDKTTMYIYKNRFCALCHNISERTLHYWNVTLECLYGILHPQNVSSIVNQVLETESCNLKYFRPTSLGKSGPLYQCRNIISECNVTGHWKIYDHFIEAACTAYSTIYSFKYKNIFCYLCNTNDKIGYSFCPDLPKPSILPDFLALLRISPEHINSESDFKPNMKCSRSKIYDPLKKLCRDIECLFPKTTENKKCINLVDFLQGIEFGIYLKMTPEEKMEVDLSELHFVVEELIKETNSSVQSKIENKCLISFKIYSKLLPVVKKQSLISIPKHKISYFVVYIEMSCGVLRPINPDVVDKLLSFHDTFLLTRTSIYNVTNVAYHVQVTVLKKESDSVPRDQFYEYIDDLNAVLIEDLPSKIKRYPLIILSIPYMCPTVRLNINEIYIVESTEFVNIEEYNATVDLNEIIIDKPSHGHSYSVRMCTSLFERIIQPFNVTDQEAMSNILCYHEKVSAKTILTVVCSTISISFSTITILVFLKIRKGKTQPVVNNIILCIALITAQSLYQFGSGQSCNVSKLACQLIGAFIHFSWLFLLFWMNSCCIHMFRVFRLNQTQITVFNVKKTTLVYFAYSLVSSMILISTNVIVSLSNSAGHDFGYGGTLCYISQGHMVLYLFAVPVAAIVLLNTILFAIVVLQIRNTSEVQIVTNRQPFLHIYAKLSTLTGCTWIFGFCGYFLTIDVIDYIFIILNASHGLFLFLSFVANKHTLRSLRSRETVDQTAYKSPISNNRDSTYSSTL